MAYRIFDSLDRPCGSANRAEDLWDMLRALQEEAEEEGDGLTYAIGKELPDGSVTFDHG